MKTQLFIASLFLVLFGYSSIKHNYQKTSFNKKFKGISQYSEDNFKKNIDTIKKEIPPYKIIKSNPALKYSIRKIGNGNKVLFFVKNGVQKLPQLDFNKTSGVYYRMGNKEGFDSVTFPFTCSISCSVNYFEHGFDNRPSLINDFKIQINEPGNWEISFK